MSIQLLLALLLVSAIVFVMVGGEISAVFGDIFSMLDPTERALRACRLRILNENE